MNTKSFLGQRLTSHVRGMGAGAMMLLLVSVPALAQTIDPFYADNYSFIDLGSVPGLPTAYGGLTVKADDPDRLLIGGNASAEIGALYEISVTRDGRGHITGFDGKATFFAEAAFNDGGVAYGPKGVLFLARSPVNELGQTKPGSDITDKIIDLAALGVRGGSPGGLNFVPPGFPGAGQLKIVTWPVGEWYTLGFAPDGAGTFDITSVTLETVIGGGPEGIAYVRLGSPLFPSPSVLVSEWSAGNIATYEVDANGDPILDTRRDFITGLMGAEGAAVDGVTGDFLFSTFGGGDRVIVVQGFVAPCPWDLDGNNDVGIGDLLILLAAWGPNPGHPADFDGNGDVGVSDLLALLANWGPCP